MRAISNSKDLKESYLLSKISLYIEFLSMLVLVSSRLPRSIGLFFSKIGDLILEQFLRRSTSILGSLSMPPAVPIEEEWLIVMSRGVEHPAWLPPPPSFVFFRA